MKTQVTLNDNGDVTVTENNTTTIHSKETALQIYEVVKADLEKPKLEEITYGRWYQNKTSPQIIVFYEKDDRVFGAVGYGFDVDARFGHANNWNLKSFKEDWQPASPETVETALRNEFIRLGGKVGAKVECLSYQTTGTVSEMKFEYYKTGDLWVKCENNRMRKIFQNGKWATIIQPETISIQEAEKRLDCKIDKNL